MFDALFRRIFPRPDAILSLLAGVPLFEGLGRRGLREVLRTLKRRTFKAGEAVFVQGQAGTGAFVVLSGRVEIVQAAADGMRATLSEVGPGGFFGEMGLLDDAPLTASAVAAEETEVAALLRSDLLAISERAPSLGVKIAIHLSQVMAERLRRTNRALKEARDQGGAAEGSPAEGPTTT